MSQRALRRTFIAFHITLCVVIFIQSIVTVLHTAGANKLQHSNIALLALASAEALAALLFLLPAAMRSAGATLLAIFAIAIALHALQGEFPSTLLVYAAGVGFVMAHGSAFGKASLAHTPRALSQSS